MLVIDPGEHIATRRAELLEEAARQRLIAQLPSRRSSLRHAVALACYRLANWLDDPTRYVQRVETGREHWAAPYAST